MRGEKLRILDAPQQRKTKCPYFLSSSVYRCLGMHYKFEQVLTVEGGVITLYQAHPRGCVVGGFVSLYVTHCRNGIYREEHNYRTGC